MILNLKEARLKKGLTLKQVSFMVKVSPGTISKYECSPGKAPADVLVRLLTIYNIPLCEMTKKKPY